MPSNENTKLHLAVQAIVDAASVPGLSNSQRYDIVELQTNGLAAMYDNNEIMQKRCPTKKYEIKSFTAEVQKGKKKLRTLMSISGEDPQYLKAFSCPELTKRAKIKQDEVKETRNNLIVYAEKYWAVLARWKHDGETHEDGELLRLWLMGTSGRRSPEINPNYKRENKKNGVITPHASTADFKIVGDYLILHTNGSKTNNPDDCAFPTLVPAAEWMRIYEVFYGLRDEPSAPWYEQGNQPIKRGPKPGNGFIFCRHFKKYYETEAAVPGWLPHTSRTLWRILIPQRFYFDKLTVANYCLMNEVLGHRGKIDNYEDVAAYGHVPKLKIELYKEDKQIKTRTYDGDLEVTSTIVQLKRKLDNIDDTEETKKLKALCLKVFQDMVDEAHVSSEHV